MGKRKQKIIIDEKKSRQKRAIRIPFPPPGEDFKDKKRYTRKQKYRKGVGEE